MELDTRGSTSCLLLMVRKSSAFLVYLFHLLLLVLIRSVVFCCVTGALCLPGLPGCPCAKPVSPQASPQLSRSSSRFSNSSRRSAGKGPYLSVQRGVDSTASPNECSCCCCNEDLIKIQVDGLLFGASLVYFSIECR